ncbi:hypothetical protein VISI1226_01195 [Vibrio sinaloensis DSM 21326]|uniref:diguanylate cyclase n=1 Tax=Vibrio sinaloensis DSM 21326 TaxID=945550 RepID=E8M5A5_PHOS4|nr:sensor domain-containing diguanylate cyclase [Vibrio sinaloensis]EGA70698.1 hypothetical protein VISI1226_01195 [Vibrio sinaloensis DSM 21326]
MLDTQLCLKQYQTELVDLSKWQEIVDLLSELYNSSTGAIVQFRNQEFNVVVSSTNEDNFLPADTTWPWEMQSFCRHVMETRDDLYVKHAVGDEYWRNAPPVAQGPVRSYCGIPITWPNGDLFGTICVIDTKQTKYPKTLTTLLNQMARLVEADISTACQLEEMKQMATRDELTDLLNRRGFNLAAAQKLKDTRHNNQPIALFYIDIDNLKQVNDNYGHDVGDHCISALAQSLKLIINESDIIARVGGDEFIVVSTVEGEKDIDYLKQQITESYHFIVHSEDEIKDTGLSIGAYFCPSSSSLCMEELVNLSDQVMYQVKQSKRATEKSS